MAWTEVGVRSAASVAGVALMSLGMTACENGTASPAPSTVASTGSALPSTPSTSSPSPSETGAPSAQRLASEAIVRYWALLDELAANPARSIDQLRAVASDQAFDQRRVALLTYREKGWHQTGSATLRDFRVDGPTDGSYVVSACVDVSGIDFLDDLGRSQVNPNRPEKQRFSYSVKASSGTYVVVRDTLKGSSC